MKRPLKVRRRATWIDALANRIVIFGCQLLLAIGFYFAIIVAGPIREGSFLLGLLLLTILPEIMCAIPAAWYRDVGVATFGWRRFRDQVAGLTLLATLFNYFVRLCFLGTMLRVLAMTEIGLDEVLWSVGGVFIGLAVSCPFMILGEWLNLWFRILLRKPPRPIWLYIHDRPARDRWSRRWDAMLTIVVKPFWEELSFRGVAIFYLGQLLHDPTQAIIGGLLLFLLIHAYHGLEALPASLMFFAIAVGLLYSPFGVLGSVGFHVGCNLYYVVRMRQVERSWRRAPTTPEKNGVGVLRVDKEAVKI